MFPNYTIASKNHDSLIYLFFRAIIVVMDLIKSLRLLGDTGRLRILRLLATEELSVADLQEIFGMGQSRISMQLSQLRSAGFVEVRRAGQKSLYRLAPAAQSELFVVGVLDRASAELPEAAEDDKALALVLRRRKDFLQTYFDELAGKFGRSYVPGRSWKALAELLLKLLPPMIIADLGAGEGTLSLMLAQRAKHVIAVDSSPRMVEYGTALAERNNIKNLTFLCGDMEALPAEIHADSVDLVFIHQALHHALHPDIALRQSFRILKPGGRIAMLDLVKHDYEAARELYADVWPGFSQVELVDMLTAAGFRHIDVAVVDRSADPPHFETLLAIASRPA